MAAQEVGQLMPLITYETKGYQVELVTHTKTKGKNADEMPLNFLLF